MWGKLKNLDDLKRVILGDGEGWSIDKRTHKPVVATHTSNTSTQKTEADRSIKV